LRSPKPSATVAAKSNSGATVALYLGLMSGTSLDGVDAVLADFLDAATQVRSHTHRPFPTALHDELLALNQAGGNELHRAALAANALAAVYAEAVAALLRDSGTPPTAVVALGAHGQTVRHRPQAFDGVGYTLQLMNGALLAEHTGIDVVCDFRSRDVAAGGQGAPLVPAFHAERFGVAGQPVAVLNLGGIANLTLLGPDGSASGFDCGPGNVLMDLWCRRHLGRAFDAGGAWAASGRADSAWLSRWLAEPYFALPPPKSTGRDLFNEEWLDASLPSAGSPADVMATLAELTARTAADALQRHSPAARLLRVCGGGAFNIRLMERLARLLPAVSVTSTAAVGVPPDQVEALAFAWLAKAFTERRAGNCVAATGARGKRVLGALYPAGFSRSGGER
jgi:anhydro-N-acetylmuramic acid kinase